MILFDDEVPEIVEHTVRVTFENAYRGQEMEYGAARELIDLERRLVADLIGELRRAGGRDA